MKASLERHNGRIKIRINDELIDPVSFRSFRPQEKIVKSFGSHGFRLMSVFPSGINSTLKVPYSQFGEVWIGDEKYNFDNLKKQVDLFVKSAPQAYLSLMVQLDTRDWFLKENPQCADTFDNIVITAGFEKWRKSAARFMCDLFDFVDENYPEKVFAIFLFCGRTCEWYTPADDGSYHPLKEKAFKVWCSDSAKTLPTYEELHNTTLGVFRHPAEDRAALEYWHFHNKIIAETIGYFARIAKQHTDNTRLVGVFAGYLMHGMPLSSGTWLFREIVNNNDIDILFSPASYTFRKLDSTSAFMLPVDSISLHNKLYFHEIDNTTHLVNDNKYAQLLHGAHNKLENMQQTVMYSRRESALALSKGMGYWWFDMFGGWFDHPELMKELEKIRLVTNELYQQNAHSVSQTAVFVDQDSYYYCANSWKDAGKILIEKQVEELNRSGFPWDNYEIDDLDHPQMLHQQYKFYVFLNLFAPKEKHLAAIKKLKEQGKSLLFIYAAGLITETDFSIKSMCDLIGINLKEFDYKDQIEFKGIVFPGKYNSSAQEIVFGFTRPIKPLFFVEDPSAQGIGFYKKSGKTALAIKKVQNRFDAWSGLGCVPASVLRELAREAGVFIYSDANDPIYINKNILGYYCHEGGKRMIKTPSDCVLHELYTDEIFQTVDKQVEISFKADEMKLFKFEK